ncbi:MAG: hypothetical protein LBS25_05735 [Candidatus Symbiothrix sp.]|jgi:hypothetical protein|nr:hypothetical protein [Candidatus Symbiothrix sp.]
MKKIFFITSFSVFFFSSCDFDASRAVFYQINEPVVMSASEFRNSVQTTGAKKITTFGKMCFYNGYLYLSDPGKGIHVINNTNPARPEIKSYIELQGNADLCIYNNRLYADAWVDVVWFDLSNPANPNLEGRLSNAFPEVLPDIQNLFPYDYELVSIAQQKGSIVVGWELKTRERQESYFVTDDVGIMSPTFSTGSGINGSMSRFGLVDNYLYAVINSGMHIFNLSGQTPMRQSDKIYIFDVETIFPYKNNLFLGTPYGMLIYSLEDPLKPQFASQISHLYGCDPVVVSDDLAYVTVRSGNFCGQTDDKLIVIDVSDIQNPQELVSYSMTNPKGLGIANDLLFLCDDGLKVFKLSAPQTLMSNKIAHFSGIDGYDVIPFNSTLMMISDKGLYQYNYSDNKVSFLSSIPVEV